MFADYPGMIGKATPICVIYPYEERDHSEIGLS